jgi:branched-chain amino acid transport system substrate-binding protein
MRGQHKDVLLVLLSLVMAVLAGCSCPGAIGEETTTVQKTAEGTPIKIGFITDLSGLGTSPGHDMVNGIKLYLQTVHNRIAGRPVELIVESDGGDPAVTLSKLKKLVEQDKVQVIDGIVKANIGYAIAPFVDKYKVPAVFPVTSGDELTKRKHYNWLVRTGWSASQPSHPFGEWVFKNLHYKRVITLAADYALGWEAVGGFQRSFEDAGGQVVQKVWLPIGFTDYSSALSNLRKDADAVFMVTYGNSAEILPEQYKQSGLKLPIIAGGITFDEAVLRHQGDEAIGAVSVLHYSGALTTEANKQFVRSYEQAYGVEPSYYAEATYTSGMWIAKAAEAVKGDVENTDKFLAALKKVELSDAPRGPVKLDDHLNPIENIYVRKVQKINGKLENTVIHTFPHVSQFWNYDPVEFLSRPPYSKDYPPCKYCSPQ